MNKLKVSAIALAAAVGLAACGGGSSNKGAGGGSTVESRTFESSFINGVTYSTPTQSGTTGVDCVDVKPGCFDVIPGEAVTFTIGNLVLPPVVAAAGQARITVVDIAKAIDEDAGILSIPARAVVAYLDALDTGDVDPVDGKRVFNVKAPADPEAAKVELNDLVAGIAEDDLAALQTKLEETLDAAGEEVAVDVDAAENTDLAKDEVGFNNGLEPIENAFEDEGLPLVISDLVGLWTLEEGDNEEGGIGGVFFGNDGNVDFTTTKAANTHGPELNDDNWNVINNQLTIAGDSEEGTTECILKARSTNSLTLSCIDFESDGTPEDDEPFEIKLTKVNNLAGILTNGDGIWNIVFEEFFDEFGTITFGPNDAFNDSITSREDDEVDTSSGTFTVTGAKLTLSGSGLNDDGVMEDFKSECFFAGLKLNAQSQPEDIFFRCLPFEEGDTEEDILLTKRAGVADLPNSVEREDHHGETVSLL